MEGVLEIRQVELRPEGHLGDFSCLDRDAVVQAVLRDTAHRPGDRVGLELHADEATRREPSRDRDEPSSTATGDVQHANPPGEVVGDRRQRCQPFLEEDGDVLDGDLFDRPMEAGRAFCDRNA